MSAINRFSEHVVDYAERLSGVADAAQGKRHPSDGRVTRWMLLPASGAALYALVKSDFFSRQAKEVVDGAKTRASELPDDLLGRVRQTSSTTTTPQRRATASGTRRTTRSRRKTGTARKTRSASR